MKYLISILWLMWGCLMIQAQPITEMEYFFDNDPGIGNGTPLTITAGDTLDFNISGIATTGLTPGFHTLFIRARDNAGNWALYVGRSFYLQPTTANLTAPALTEIEYFYDNDPGVGNGTLLTIPTADTVDALFSGISTAGLTEGFHTLFVRSRNADGTWGIYIGRSIYIQGQASSQPEPPVANGEYFFDTDPGVGNGIPISFGQTDTLDTTFTGISTNSLTSGFHTIFLRFFGADGIVGVYQGRTFYVQEAISQDSIPIVGLEYLFDIDTGGGTGTYLALTPTADLDTVIQAPVGNLSFGTHDLFVRVVDSVGNWSLVAIDSFVVGNCSSFTPTVSASDSTSFCEGDSVQLTVMQAYSSYQWSNGSNSHSIVVSQSGNYSVTVTDSTGCSGSSVPITVNVLASPQPMVQSNAAFSFCSGDSIMLSTDQPYTNYLWSTGETTPTIFVSQSGTYSVTVGDGNNCEGNSEPVMTEKKPTPLSVSISSLGNDSLQASGMGDYFHWYLNDSLISGQNEASMLAPLSGTYRVQVFIDGCSSPLSDPYELWLTNTDFMPGFEELSIYPNPFISQMTIEIEDPGVRQLDVQILDITGREWLNRQSVILQGGKLTLAMGALPAGVYVAHISDTEHQRESFVRLVKGGE